MDIFDKAITIAGGVSRLAEALGVRQNVVSNWRKRRVPRAWRMVLQDRYGNLPEPAPGVTPTASEPASDNAGSAGVGVAHG